MSNTTWDMNLQSATKVLHCSAVQNGVVRNASVNFVTHFIRISRSFCCFVLYNYEKTNISIEKQHFYMLSIDIVPKKNDPLPQNQLQCVHHPFNHQASKILSF